MRLIQLASDDKVVGCQVLCSEVLGDEEVTALPGAEVPINAAETDVSTDADE